MSAEETLVRRIHNDPKDIEAILALCTILMDEGRPVPLDLQEASLRHHLSQDPKRHDLAFRLSMVLMEQGRPVSPGLEEKALRHCIAVDPGRLDLYDRFIAVAVENCLVPSRGSDQRTVGAADRAIVARARHRLAGAASESVRHDLPALGVRWDAYAQRMREAIARLGDTIGTVRYAQSEIGFEHRVAASQALQHFALYERELKSEFPHYEAQLSSLDDPPQSVPHTQFTVGRRAVSNIVPYLSRVIMSCLTTLPAPRTILELGGGYGALARLWMTNSIAPARNYVIVDIPESLFFADVFLSATFGSDEVHYVDDAASIDRELLDRHRIILCPVARLGALEALPIDLVINTGSLQEMSEGWVSFYMRWLDRQTVRFFYSLNYAVQPLRLLGESINLWSPHPSPSWMARVLRWNPPLVRMQSERNYLEAVYEKVPAELSASAARSRLEALGERTMNGQTLVEYLDVFRRCLQPDVALTILRRVKAEIRFHPKEALWLAEWLERKGSDAMADHVLEVASYRTVLAAERASGVEGTT